MGARRPKVLIVDDEENIVLALHHVLYQDNDRYDVLLARSAEIARQIMLEVPIDVLVTDVHLPERSGMDLLSWVAFKAPGTRVIVMTAYDIGGIKDRAHAFGCVRLVQKPFDVREMRDAIMRALEQHDAFSGSLADLSIIDVIQMLCIARKTTALRVAEGASSGVILIDKGELHHAVWDDLKGEEAFERMLDVRNGVFSSSPLPADAERTIQGDWQYLLIEGLRKLDEAAIAPDADRESRERDRPAVRFSPFSLPPGPETAPSSWPAGRFAMNDEVTSSPRLVPQRLPRPPALPSDGRGEVARYIDEGFAALRAGRIDDARRAWEEALRLDPQNRRIEVNLRKLESKTAGQRG